MNLRGVRVLCVLLLVALGGWISVRGDDPPATSRSSTMPPEMAVVTPERESAALLFAQRHHPELRGLLDRLKENNPDQYNEAIADLFRTSERLAGMQARMPERHDLELEKWKLDSRIRLVTARLVTSESSELQGQLRDLLAARVGVRLQLLEEERTRIANRLARIEQQITTLDSESDATVDRELNNLLRMARRNSDPE